MCIHSDVMEPEWCVICKGEHRQPVKTRPARKPKIRYHGPKTVEAFVAEYVSGARCRVCDQMRDGKGRCKCDRDRQFEVEASTIAAFVVEHEDTFRGAEMLAQAALKRASLRAGYREAPDPSGTGATQHQALMLGYRANIGQPLVWQRRLPAGDELPL